MDEDFIFQVTEEELAQFPEEEGIEKEQKEGSKSPIEPVQKVGEETTLQKEKVNIPSLLDLKLPRLYCFVMGGGFLSVKDAFSETGYPAFYR